MIGFMTWLQSFSTPQLDQFFLFLSSLANEMLFVLFIVIIYWCIDKEKGFVMVCSLAFGMLLNLNIKNLLKVPRPFEYSEIIQKDLLTGYGYSFPSAHSQMTASFFSSFYANFRYKAVLIAGILLTFLIGLSRIYLGVHTPVDVLFGILIGIAVIILSQYIIHKILEHKKFWLLYLLLIPGFIGILLSQDKDLLKITPLFFGFLVGFSLEHRFIRFEVKNTLSVQIIKVAAGIIVLLLFQLGLKLIGDYFWINQARYFMTGFSITYLCPLLFQKLFKNQKRS